MIWGIFCPSHPCNRQQTNRVGHWELLWYRFWDSSCWTREAVIWYCSFHQNSTSWNSTFLGGSSYQHCCYCCFREGFSRTNRPTSTLEIALTIMGSNWVRSRRTFPSITVIQLTCCKTFPNLRSYTFNTIPASKCDDGSWTMVVVLPQVLDEQQTWDAAVCQLRAVSQRCVSTRWTDLLVSSNDGNNDANDVDENDYWYQGVNPAVRVSDGLSNKNSTRLCTSPQLLPPFRSTESFQILERASGS